MKNFWILFLSLTLGFSSKAQEFNFEFEGFEDCELEDTFVLESCDFDDCEENFEIQDPKKKPAKSETEKEKQPQLTEDEQKFVKALSEKLDAYVGKNISAICPCGFHDNEENHCAHGVCHILDYRVGLYTCDKLVGSVSSEKKKQGAAVRVQEIFAICPQTGTGPCQDPSKLKPGLIFAIQKDAKVNAEKKSMPNVPRKHIGIFVDNHVYHYSNSRDQWVKVPLDEFKTHYGEGTQIFWGEFISPPVEIKKEKPSKTEPKK